MLLWPAAAELGSFCGERRCFMDEFEYDVGISFASEDRDIASQLARRLRRRKMKVFYDEYEKTKLWGEDLYKYLFSVFSEKCRYCIILFSEAYSEKAWPKHELRAAQARLVEDSGDFLLPIRIEECDLPEELTNMSYLTYPETSLTDIAKAVHDKWWEAIKHRYIPLDNVVKVLHDETVIQTIMNRVLPRLVEGEQDDATLLTRALFGLITLIQTSCEYTAFKSKDT
jgi:hypothetical protein